LEIIDGFGWIVMTNTDRQHPQASKDRTAIGHLLSGAPTDGNLVELARLRIRYRGFPGARDIQADLDRLLQQWQLTEEELFVKTRAIYQEGNVYASVRSNKRDDEDWS
jgi:Protein of unknown function (DUF3288)